MSTPSQTLGKAFCWISRCRGKASRSAVFAERRMPLPLRLVIIKLANRVNCHFEPVVREISINKGEISHFVPLDCCYTELTPIRDGTSLRSFQVDNFDFDPDPISVQLTLDTLSAPSSIRPTTPPPLSPSALPSQPAP